jgi:SlyX protein
MGGFGCLDLVDAARLSEGGDRGKRSGAVTDLARLEETLAHLVRTVDDLSEVVARQDAEITQLGSRVRLLMEREAAREAADGGGIPLADKPPPHW